MLTPETLTLEAARNLEAGPETDSLIASICGKTGGKIFGTFSPEKDLKFGFPVSDSGLLAMRTWSPSTDANAAIEAAEAVGCNWAAQATCRCESVNKFAMHFLWGQDGNDSLSLAPTFPLALCRAIAVRYVLERDRVQRKSLPQVLAEGIEAEIYDDREANRKTIAGDVP